MHSNGTEQHNYPDTDTDETGETGEIAADRTTSAAGLPGRDLSPYDSSRRYLLETVAGLWC